LSDGILRQPSFVIGFKGGLEFGDELKRKRIAGFGRGHDELLCVDFWIEEYAEEDQSPRFSLRPLAWVG
jgi:hypothetical protein